MSNKFIEPAFPISSEMCGHWAGMTLRDYFAAKAMQAMVTAEFNMNVQRKYWAEEAYRVADAMLEERAK